MKTKILYVIPSLGVGGAEEVALNICRFLDNKSFEYKFIVLGTKENSINDKRASLWGINVIYLNKKNGLDISLFKKLRKLIIKYQPDVIHTHMAALFYANFSLLFTKNIMHVHTFHCIPNVRKYYGFPMILAKKIFNKKNFFPISISNYQSNYLLSNNIVKSQKMKCIYNGIETLLYSSNKIESFDSLKMIYVGSFSDIKNQIDAIRILNILKDSISNISLILVGEGPLKKHLQDYVKELNINNYVTFTGNVENVQDYLSLANLYISTSLIEANPLSILQAISSGLPVVAYNVGGIKDIVKDKQNGFLIKKYDITGFVNCINCIFNDKSLWQSMSDFSKLESRNYNILNCVKKYEKIYRG